MSTSSRTDPETILIGRVVSAHGLRGELDVVPLTDFPERFEKMESVALYRGGQFLRNVGVLGVRLGKKETLTLSTDLEGREEAEACAGAEIRIAPDERVELPPDSFWVDDLIGLRVEDGEGRALGMVTDFLNGGANELYEVRGEDGKTRYIPAVAEFVREIDVKGGRLVVSLIEGLWDLPDAGGTPGVKG